MLRFPDAEDRFRLGVPSQHGMEPICLKEEKNHEDLYNERHRSGKPDGRNAWRGAYDDASRQTDEKSDCKKRSDDVPAARGLLDEMKRMEADSDVCLFLWNMPCQKRKMIETTLRIVYNIAYE